MMEDSSSGSRSGCSGLSVKSEHLEHLEVTLTPGRTRNIAQDMEALRLSRQDNPFLQRVMASRESLIESSTDECESDDAVLMSQEFGNSSLDILNEDPVTLKQIHDHMIRSPPPISFWPHDNLSPRASSAFDFSGSTPHCISYSALSINNSDHVKDFFNSSILRKSPMRVTAKLHNTSEDLRGDSRTNSRNNNPIRTRSSSRPISPKSKDSYCTRPLSLPGETHLKNALGKAKQTSQYNDRFSILHHPVPIRMTAGSKSSFAEDSVHLVDDSDK